MNKRLGISAAIAASIAVTGCATNPNYGYNDPYYNNGYNNNNDQARRAATGAAVGAASGALAGQLSDIGINDDFMRDTASALPPGGSAVFVLLRKMTADKVLERLQSFHHRGRVLQTSLSQQDEDRLRAALSGGGSVPPATPPSTPPATGA